jgi:hypothetical protein
MDDAGGLVKAVKRAAWKGAFMVPGAGITLAVLVRQMVEEAIRRAGNEEA